MSSLLWCMYMAIFHVPNRRQKFQFQNFAVQNQELNFSYSLNEVQLSWDKFFWILLSMRISLVGVMMGFGKAILNLRFFVENSIFQSSIYQSEKVFKIENSWICENPFVFQFVYRSCVEGNCKFDLSIIYSYFIKNFKNTGIPFTLILSLNLLF